MFARLPRIRAVLKKSLPFLVLLNSIRQACPGLQGNLAGRASAFSHFPLVFHWITGLDPWPCRVETQPRLSEYQFCYLQNRDSHPLPSAVTTPCFLPGSMRWAGLHGLARVLAHMPPLAPIVSGKPGLRSDFWPPFGCWVTSLSPHTLPGDLPSVTGRPCLPLSCPVWKEVIPYTWLNATQSVEKQPLPRGRLGRLDRKQVLLWVRVGTVGTAERAVLLGDRGQS